MPYDLRFRRIVHLLQRSFHPGGHLLNHVVLEVDQAVDKDQGSQAERRGFDVLHTGTAAAPLVMGRSVLRSDDAH